MQGVTKQVSWWGGVYSVLGTLWMPLFGESFHVYLRSIASCGCRSDRGGVEGCGQMCTLHAVFVVVGLS
jgi:hypothetical protein